MAVAEPRPWRLKKVADGNQVPDDLRFDDWRPLVAKGKIADAVAISVLDDMHAEVVDHCAKLGYAILCEKVSFGGPCKGDADIQPIATSIPDCLSLIQSVEKAGVIFGCGHGRSRSNSADTSPALLPLQCGSQRGHQVGNSRRDCQHSTHGAHRVGDRTD